MEERLQKILAHAGFGSRRTCETLITAGRVRVNGQIAVLGQKADAATDTITVDGTAIPAAEPLVYIALHKPRGVLSAVEAPDPRPTVRDLVEAEGTLYPVGRLDLDSEGLILLTNDGKLTHRLLHPRYGHQKEYKVLVARQPDDKQLAAFRHGVVLEDGERTAPADVKVARLQGKGAWLNVILREGRKRQIRETCASIGLPVVKLIRVRIGTLRLGSLKPREWRYLTPEEIKELQAPAARPRPAAGRKPAAGSPHGSGAVRRRSERPAAKPAGKREKGRPSRSDKPGPRTRRVKKTA
ncbi:MAG: pseudouridine synthase [Chloroflexota bacterium]